MIRSLAAVALSLAAANAAANPGDPPRPHIVFFLADDFGYYNVGFRNPLEKTPVIDAAAKESASLERHYVFKFCSPTRRSFLTGRLPVHNGMDNTELSAADLRMTTVAKKLQEVGYYTVQSGKWHCGWSITAQTPQGRGFNSSLGYFQGAEDHFNQTHKSCNGAVDLWNTDLPAFNRNGTYGDYTFTQHSVQQIMDHDPSQPMFLYHAAQVAHDPMQAPQRFLDMYDPDVVPDQTEYAFSSVLDEAFDNITQALKTKGMWDNTLLIFSSDNGGPSFSDQHAASNFPLRGGKYTLWEGGVRVTAFVGGGFLPNAMRGKNISSPIAVADWYVTLANLAGADPSDNHTGVPPVDGVDQWPLLSGATATGPRTEVFVGPGVLIQGEWKFIANESAGIAQWSGPLYPKVKATGPETVHCTTPTKLGCLFNIVTDAGEHNDVALENPSITKAMADRLAELTPTIWSPTYPDVPPNQLCNATVRNGNYLTPSDWKQE